MGVIWKFSLQDVEVNEFTMPKGAEILTVQSQFGDPKMWVLVDLYNEQENRRFEIYGTGQCVPGADPNEKRVYINTFQRQGGHFIFHVFELITKEPSVQVSDRAGDAQGEKEGE